MTQYQKPKRDRIMKKSDYIADILINGTGEEIKNIKYDCGGNILFNYLPKNHAMKFYCDKCNILVSLHKMIKKPNFVRIYGNSNMNG